MIHDQVDVRKGGWDDGYTVDMAGEIDKPHEVLAEILGITPAQALRVSEWAAEFATQVSESEKVSQLREIVANLMPSKLGSVEVLVGGLVAASGMSAGITARTMEEIAQRVTQKCRCVHCGKTTEQTVTKAAVSHSAVVWADKLGLKNYTMCRDDETRENNRAARMRVVEEGRKA